MIPGFSVRNDFHLSPQLARLFGYQRADAIHRDFIV
jgi:hypothetical protein